tara:strand:+ start:110 stop:868 length:759 start_codon:yes stop_codon:yes gene_type:complete
MAKKLFKKSYLYKNFKEISYQDLWNTKGVFTTIRLYKSSSNFLFLSDHLNQLNKSLKKMKINFNLTRKIFDILVHTKIKRKQKYDHLLRIAVNNKIISVDLRKRLKSNFLFDALLISYQRPNASIKNLKYKKILHYLGKIDFKSNEVILTSKGKILEGCTTNIICVKKNKLYFPKKGYYSGITLKFIKNHTKRKIIKKDIMIKDLNNFDEILLVGSGKGIVALNKIPEINWKRKSVMIFNELRVLYNSYISR